MCYTLIIRTSVATDLFTGYSRVGGTLSYSFFCADVTFNILIPNYNQIPGTYNAPGIIETITLALSALNECTTTLV